MDEFEQKIDGTLQTWEILIQALTDNSDLLQLVRCFEKNRRSFKTEFRKKNRCLAINKFKNNAKLDKVTKRLAKLQKKYFAKNEEKQLAIAKQTQKLQLIETRRTNIEQGYKKFVEIHQKFYQKVNEVANCVVIFFHRFKQHGLSKETIQKFEIFTADESHVGDQCSICMENVEVGRIMRRLTCDGQHYFCQECIEGWFAEHNTCPLCRHKFD